MNFCTVHIETLSFVEVLQTITALGKIVEMQEASLLLTSTVEAGDEAADSAGLTCWQIKLLESPLVLEEMRESQRLTVAESMRSLPPFFSFSLERRRDWQLNENVEPPSFIGSAASPVS